MNLEVVDQLPVFMKDLSTDIAFKRLVEEMHTPMLNQIFSRIKGLITSLGSSLANQIIVLFYMKAFENPLLCQMMLVVVLLKKVFVFKLNLLARLLTDLTNKGGEVPMAFVLVS